MPTVSRVKLEGRAGEDAIERAGRSGGTYHHNRQGTVDADTLLRQVNCYSSSQNCQMNTGQPIKENRDNQSSAANHWDNRRAALRTVRHQDSRIVRQQEQNSRRVGQQDSRMVGQQDTPSMSAAHRGCPRLMVLGLTRLDSAYLAL